MLRYPSQILSGSYILLQPLNLIGKDCLLTNLSCALEADIEGLTAYQGNINTF